MILTDVTELIESSGHCYAQVGLMQFAHDTCENYKDMSFLADDALLSIDNYAKCSKRTLYFARDVLLALENCFTLKIVDAFEKNLIPLGKTRDTELVRFPYGNC